MTVFWVHQFPSSSNILFQSLIIAPLHAIFFSFFFFETVENVRHRKKRPAAHSTNTCRVFSSFPVCFPSDRAPSDNFVSARTRVGGMGECRGKSRRFSSIFFETFVTRFFPLGFFSLSFPLCFSYAFCYNENSARATPTSFVRLRRGARRFCSHPFLLASLVFLLRHSPSKFSEEQTSTTNIHGWPSRWPEQ